MYSSSCNFLQFHRTTTIPIPNASPFMLRRSSYGFGVFHRKRARFKRQSRSLVLVNSSIFPPPFDGSVPLDSLAPSVAGFASGLAVYLSSRLLGRSSEISDRRRSIVDDVVVGEWILFTSPTPFNRFVLLRCCSLLSFDDSDSLSDRLVSEERHFVTLDSGKITLSAADEKTTPLEYQRVCITTEDGGVVSLDWPANLDIREERGLDTTVIFIPGTPQGSMDEGVRSFVCEALRRGMFPVVMNPRGCAGSPLTTPR